MEAKLGHLPHIKSGQQNIFLIMICLGEIILSNGSKRPIRLGLDPQDIDGGRDIYDSNN